MHEEPRQKLHLILLNNLHYLARTVAHLWTNENINSFIAYTHDQNENNLVLLSASEILCTLSQQSNVYFYFVFNTQDNLELQEEQQLDEKRSVISDNKNLVDNKVLKNLIEKNVFHEDHRIAYNFCLFSTTLLVFQSNNIRKLDDARRALLDSSFILDSNHLFELAKNGLFSIILECNKKLMTEHLLDQINLLKVKHYLFFTIIT